MQIKKLILTVKSRDGDVFSAPVKSVTSNNDKGRFDVLSYHANFISLIKDYVEYIDMNDKKTKLQVRDAVMRVEDNKVDVFIGV